ncbi:MAG: cytidine deaminase [Anaerolineales bacterium]|jgi:cytidine deaminase
MTLTAQQRSELIRSALSVREHAYAPYSNYAVGAALLGADGAIYSGVNVENASYPLSMCAERSAIFKAVSEGVRSFTAIAVASDNGGSPCGACRQVLSEFGLDMTVLILNAAGDVTLETTVSDLLPHAFTPRHLQER